mmetsp:Transcript_2164/g.5294  ORF Transcript_2164/g.5294 Transcript_2164/m.5294 type:complete len:82 (+) Transcript_2164:411-656(+)
MMASNYPAAVPILEEAVVLSLKTAVDPGSLLTMAVVPSLKTAVDPRSLLNGSSSKSNGGFVSKNSSHDGSDTSEFTLEGPI